MELCAFWLVPVPLLLCFLSFFFFFFLKMLDQCWTKKKIKNKPRDVSLHHQSLCFRTSQFEHPLWLMSPSTRPWKRWRQRTFKNLEIQLFHKCFLFLFSFFLGGLNQTRPSSQPHLASLAYACAFTHPEKNITWKCGVRVKSRKRQENRCVDNVARRL